MAWTCLVEPNGLHDETRVLQAIGPIDNYPFPRGHNKSHPRVAGVPDDLGSEPAPDWLMEGRYVRDGGVNRRFPRRGPGYGITHLTSHPNHESVLAPAVAHSCKIACACQSQ
jgi:hypothetical protein